jgi:hypothetical protein
MGIHLHIVYKQWNDQGRSLQLRRMFDHDQTGQLNQNRVYKVNLGVNSWVTRRIYGVFGFELLSSIR